MNILLRLRFEKRRKNEVGNRLNSIIDFLDVKINDREMFGLFSTIIKFSEMASNEKYYNAIDQRQTKHHETKFKVNCLLTK